MPAEAAVAALPSPGERGGAAMHLHQVLTGAVNPGDNCYSVGSVEDIPFTVMVAMPGERRGRPG